MKNLIPANLLDMIMKQGIKLTLTGDNINIEAPKGAYTPEVKSFFRENKKELIDLLKFSAGGDPGLEPDPPAESRPSAIPEQLGELDQVAPADPPGEIVVKLGAWNRNILKKEAVTPWVT